MFIVLFYTFALVMNLQELQTLFGSFPLFETLSRELQKGREQHFVLSGLCGSTQAMAIAALSAKLSRQMLVLLDSPDEVFYMQADISSLTGRDTALCFPSPYRIKQRHSQADESYVIQRTELLQHLAAGRKDLVILTYPEALLSPVPPKQDLNMKTVSLRKGEQKDVGTLQKELMDLGFTKVDFVYEPGQYAIRGGIFDVFSFSNAEPYRVDFFGDEVDSIRVFDLETQLSKQKVESIQILPDIKPSDSQTTSLFDYLSDDAIIVSADFSLLKHKLGSSLSDLSQSIVTEVIEKVFFQSYSTLELSQKAYFDNSSIFRLHTLPQPVYHKNFDLVDEELKEYSKKGYRIYILSDSQKQIDRIDAIINDRQENTTHIDLIPVSHTLHEGFICQEMKMVCLTDHQLFERYHKVQQKTDTARQGKVLLTLKELNQLQVGDYVVHVDHGIARFGGLVRTPVNGKMQEMIKLIYRDNDILFVSIHSLHRISKYRGKEGGEPNISKLGSGAWERMKERTKQKVKDIARDLIQLYALRRQEKGFQYSPDSYLQHELEASFIYEDTPDQQKATIDTKHDMESSVPMDRLICGDVGFGKTEVAMRAAFKAATDNKQTAVLVPTTVLALQHYNTFTERFKNFPVTVEYLSRAKSPKETKEILAKLERGEIDILIGTHKLVGKQVHFKDLGLLIIDEEQKFGVTTKEKLRQLKANVDTLTLTATPIPRTLQFSLLGARDLSVMNTPPPNRYPVQTECITIDDEDIIQEAVRQELSRNGQVFIVSNRIQTLDAVENKIRRLCPEARIVTAHGQMPPETVEQVLYDFINYEYDILISTSIIESGVDIPNVNTIIINSAQQFGLSDLHQLRGRVGRSNRKAYCYLITPPQELLTAEARRRLQAIETFSDLGSGFHLAMQDLDIRGAGNLLGAEQSGFIADLGYETYQRILNEAVIELRTEEFAELLQDTQDKKNDNYPAAQTQWVSDCQLDSDLEIGFPQDYVENISERITLYRELDSLSDETALVNFQKRLIDRFGILPPAAEELLQVVRLRWLCMRMGIEKIILKMNRMTIYFPQNKDSAYYQSEIFGKIIDYMVLKPRRCQLREQNERRSAVILNIKSIADAWNLLTQISQ